MNISTELRNVDANYKVINKYPQLKNIPVIIGEFDPEGCAACGMSTNPENAYRNGTMYSSYTAASFARLYELTTKYKINLLGAVSWSFEFENQPWFAGFRDLATNGVNKPVLNVFKMFGMMQGNRVEAKSSQMYGLKLVLDSSIRKANTDVGVLATKGEKSAAVLIWNYHDQDKVGTKDSVSVALNGLTKSVVTITHYRIDNENSNSYETWKKMGSPQQPTTAQIALLEKSSQLQTIGKPIKFNTKSGSYKFELGRQGISMLKIE
jgi:xylan 1,4-beta-xylosidase